MIKKYRKKPVVIEAVQYTGHNFDEIQDFVNQGTRPLKMTEMQTPVIETLEGDHYVSINDFVIKGVHNEFYPCKPDIFEKTYEDVD